MPSGLVLLSDIRVVEFGDAFAPSVCAYHLALLGADVLLAEEPEGCELRRLAKRRSSGLFAYSGRGKRCVPIGTALAGDPPPDIVFEPSFSPPILAELKQAKGDERWVKTVFVSFREMDGSQLTELTAQAEGGMATYLGKHDAPPQRVGFELVTYSAATLGVQAILAALRLRAQTGHGQHIRIPLSRVSAAILNNVITATAQPDQHVHFSRGWEHDPAQGLAAPDGSVEILFYGPPGERGWKLFCERLGVERLITDPRFHSHAARLDHGVELCDALVPWTKQLPRDALIALVREVGGMAMPKHTVAQAMVWDQTVANGMVQGAPGYCLPVAPWELNGTRSSVAGLAA